MNSIADLVGGNSEFLVGSVEPPRVTIKYSALFVLWASLMSVQFQGRVRSSAKGCSIEGEISSTVWVWIALAALHIIFPALLLQEFSEGGVVQMLLAGLLGVGLFWVVKRHLQNSARLIRDEICRATRGTLEID